MVDVTRSVIRLGNFSDGIADIDPNGTGSAENASALVGQTFTGATMSVETIVYSDGDSNGFINFDDFVGPGGDYVVYDLGAGPVSETVDQSVWYNITVSLVGGGTVNTSALIFQTPSGETFLTEFSTPLDNLDIASITPTSVSNNLFSRMATSNSVDNTTVCFGSGTWIGTPSGPRPVEQFLPGDMVWTTDGSAQPVVGVYRIDHGRHDTADAVCFAAGSLGAAMPQEPLYLTGNHRVLCCSRLVQRMFDEAAILIPAKRFVGCDLGAEPVTDETRAYFHLELERHSIIWANGALVESCLMGPMAIAALPRTLALSLAGLAAPSPRYPVPSGRRQRDFLRRLKKNGHPVVDDTILPKGMRVPETLCQMHDARLDEVAA